MKRSVGVWGLLFALRPDARVGPLGVEFDVNDIGIAADGAVFNVFLIGALGEVEGDDDGFATGGTGVGTLVSVETGGGFLSAFFHDLIVAGRARGSRMEKVPLSWCG